jgi:hypothetical protein
MCVKDFGLPARLVVTTNGTVVAEGTCCVPSITNSVTSWQRLSCATDSRTKTSGLTAGAGAGSDTRASTIAEVDKVEASKDVVVELVTRETAHVNVDANARLGLNQNYVSVVVCSGATTVGFDVALSITGASGARLFEVQWGNATLSSSSGSSRWHGSQTSTSPNITVNYLQADTAFNVRGRFSSTNEVVGWSAWSSASTTCATTAVPANAPFNLRRVAADPGSVTVAWDAPQVSPSAGPPHVAESTPQSRLLHGTRQPASTPHAVPSDAGLVEHIGKYAYTVWVNNVATIQSTTSTSATVHSMVAGQLVSVRISVVGGGTTGTVEFRTGPPASGGVSRFVSMIRVSERQGPTASEIDFLTNHDAGDALGDGTFSVAV